jgi:hypothetical protein
MYNLKTNPNFVKSIEKPTGRNRRRSMLKQRDTSLLATTFLKNQGLYSSHSFDSDQVIMMTELFYDHNNNNLKTRLINEYSSSNENKSSNFLKKSQQIKKKKLITTEFVNHAFTTSANSSMRLKRKTKRFNQEVGLLKK